MMTLEELRTYSREVTDPLMSSPTEVVSWDGQLLRLRRVPSPLELRPGNVIAGPAIIAYADHAAYLVVVGSLGRGAQHTTTVSMHCDFLRRAVLAPLILDCTVLKLGRRLVVTDTLITPEGTTKPVARVSTTYTNPTESADWMGSPSA